MALVKFFDTTSEKYNALEAKDTNALYFLENGQLYKGDVLVTNVQLVSAFPLIGIKNTLYINASTEQLKYYDGSKYVNLSRPFVTEINEESTDGQIPTAAAVRNYVDSKTGETLVFSTYIEFPVSGNENTLYIDESANKTYRYSAESGSYYVVGSNYEDIKIINGDF